LDQGEGCGASQNKAGQTERSELERAVEALAGLTARRSGGALQRLRPSEFRLRGWTALARTSGDAPAIHPEVGSALDVERIRS
jgi:hypothetical protein